jgi:hypothetical protein
MNSEVSELQIRVLTSHLRGPDQGSGTEKVEIEFNGQPEAGADCRRIQRGSGVRNNQNDRVESILVGRYSTVLRGIGYSSSSRRWNRTDL